ncbi:hypothetical protein [Micromonospora tarensis]|uniref:Uncharacterized protein n=1 Tax=Micromonospora tarensis TaxID=2806100 RepID=A0ABS1YBK4_9ACTN|nr:hypothetical protein [Micromonospora tarensis]MBM0274694.1 hypothetical protein [Micromonospora tarensis]
MERFLCWLIGDGGTGRPGGAHRCPPALHPRPAQTPPRPPPTGRHHPAPLTLEPFRRPLTAGHADPDVRTWRAL